MKKTIIALAMSVMFAFGTASALTLDQLRSAILAVNEDCPQYIDDSITINSYELVGNNLCITYLLSSQEMLGMVEVIKDEMAEIMLKAMLEDEASNMILSACVSNKINLVTIWTCKGCTSPVRATLPYTTIAKELGMTAGVALDKKATREEFQRIISTMQADLPNVIDEDMTWQSISLNNKELLSVFYLDEISFYSVSLTEDIMRDTLLDTMKSEEGSQFLFDYCKELNLNYTIRYVNRDTMEAVDFTYTPDEF